jgi:hypothetical protein
MGKIKLEKKKVPILLFATVQVSVTDTIKSKIEELLQLHHGSATGAAVRGRLQRVPVQKVKKKKQFLSRKNLK